MNPGPPKEDPCKGSNELLSLMRSINVKIDKNHEEVLSELNAVKVIQVDLQKQMTNINDRLSAVEVKLAASENCAEFEIARAVTEVVDKETAGIHSRLDEFEDRSRRDNLIFYGFADEQTETWADSEKKVRDIISSALKIELADEAISRAHRLGKFFPNKCRPIIAKFNSSKAKSEIFVAKSQLKTAGITVSEDFCISTRTARKKLIEFGKASGEQFSLRYNKLIIKKKSYIYHPASNSVCEIESETSAEQPSFHPPNTSRTST